MTALRYSRIFWIGAAAILAAAALVALVAIISGRFSDTDGRILGTLGATLLAGSTLIAGAALATRSRPFVGWLVEAVSSLAFVAFVYGVWSFGEGDDGWRWLYSGVLVLVATLLIVTAQLVASTARGHWLAWIACLLASAASLVSIAAIWQADPGSTIGKFVGIAWVLATLSYFAVPLVRLATPEAAYEERVLATLDDIELVATTGTAGLAVELVSGERLALRRRTRP